MIAQEIVDRRLRALIRRKAAAPFVVVPDHDTAGRKQPFADTSPAELLPSGARVVMVHGVLDPVMPPYTGRDYVLKLRKAGDAGELVTIPNAAHFDLVIPTTAAWTEIVAILDREMKALPR